MFERFRRSLDRTEPKPRLKEYARKDLAAFVEFAKQQSFGGYANEEQENVIRNAFYTSPGVDIDSQWKSCQMEQVAYNERAAEMIARVTGIIPKELVGGNDAWLQIQTVTELEATSGKFFLNPHPEFLEVMLLAIIEAARQQQIRLACKIPKKMEFAFTSARADNLTVYARAEDERAVVALVRDTAARHQALLRPYRPALTAPVLADGKPLKGIGFGEEYMVAGTSFGQVRSKLLADLVRAHNGDMRMREEESVQQIFMKLCTQQGVDPYNPAFNLGGTEWQAMRASAQ